jgi:hypothetical protein
MVENKEMIVGILLGITLYLLIAFLIGYNVGTGISKDHYMAYIDENCYTFNQKVYTFNEMVGPTETNNNSIVYTELIKGEIKDGK